MNDNLKSGVLGKRITIHMTSGFAVSGVVKSLDDKKIVLKVDDDAFIAYRFAIAAIRMPMDVATRIPADVEVENQSIDANVSSRYHVVRGHQKSGVQPPKIDDGELSDGGVSIPLDLLEQEDARIAYGGNYVDLSVSFSPTQSSSAKTSFGQGLSGISFQVEEDDAE